MKQLVLAIAITTLGSAAYAQSSVTVFGILDVNVRNVDNDGVGRQNTLSNNGINSSRLGFRGVEDLGGGMRASFWLESDINPDLGTTNPNGKLFARQATVSLHGGFGELRLGRHYTPTGWNQFEFDPWSVIGVGGSATIARFAGQRTFYRTDNAVHYYLPPDIGGIYGQATHAFDEGAPDAQYSGARLGFKSGSLNTAVAVGTQEVVGGDFKIVSFGVSYKVSVVTLMLQYNNDKLIANKEERILLGAVVTLSSGEIRTSFVRSDASDGTAAFNANDASLVTLGYVHNLSRRTALYGTAARVDNKGAATFAISGGRAGITPGGASTGIEVGLRHLF